MSSLSSSSGLSGVEASAPVRRVSPGDPEKRREQQERKHKQKQEGGSETPHHSPHDEVELHEGAEGGLPAGESDAGEVSSNETPRADDHPHIDVQG